MVVTDWKAAENLVVCIKTEATYSQYNTDEVKTFKLKFDNFIKDISGWKVEN